MNFAQQRGDIRRRAVGRLKTKPSCSERFASERLQQMEPGDFIPPPRDCNMCRRKESGGAPHGCGPLSRPRPGTVAVALPVAVAETVRVAVGLCVAVAEDVAVGVAVAVAAQRRAWGGGWGRANDT